MAAHPLAGKPVPESMFINVPRLVTAYYANKPDPEDPAQRVAFGTSGHRGSSLKSSFNDDHIAAVTQAVCDYRMMQGISGPLFLGMDTHALSESALATALEVLAANKVDVMIQEGLGYTPTPVISHAILTYNNSPDQKGQADGIVVTPSHNPPDNGGFKYNPPHGGPADTETTKTIEGRANRLLQSKLTEVKRIPLSAALKADTTHEYDYITPYVNDLENVLDMEAISRGKLKIGVDPLGGAGIHYWDVIAERYNLDMTLVNRKVDPTFGFMSVDHDGKIRMDCSSPWAMAGLINLKDQFDVAFGNDPDYDRHGIVTKEGLMNPNHYLSVAVWYLFQNRPQWDKTVEVGKTVVTSGMIDRVAAHLKRRLTETPVGFKWFVPGLLAGKAGFGGEESAGASFLRKDGTVWSTDKDGIIMDLLAAEIMVCCEKSPSEIYQEMTKEFGAPIYIRSEAPASAEQKAAFKGLRPEMVSATSLAGEPIKIRMTNAPGNNAPIGGIKVMTENGWFAARPSGTEEIYKIYAESFKGQEHLDMLLDEAKAIVNAAFQSYGV